MTDDLVKRLRDWSEYDEGKINDAREEAADRIEQLEAARDGAYTERNRLVALLASLFPSGTKKTDIPGWDKEWHGCVYIDLPVGQASWHYHDSEAHLFAHLPPYEMKWDGHTTEEKYERILLAANHAKQTNELLADYMKFADALMIHTNNQNKRIEQLEAALREIEEAGVPRTVARRWRSDGMPSKHDQCAHGMAMYEDCGNCIADFARAALGEKKDER